MEWSEEEAAWAERHVSERSQSELNDQDLVSEDPPDSGLQ